MNMLILCMNLMVYMYNHVYYFILIKLIYSCYNIVLCYCILIVNARDSSYMYFINILWHTHYFTSKSNDMTVNLQKIIMSLLWNLRITDTSGAAPLSIVERLSLIISEDAITLPPALIYIYSYIHNVIHLLIINNSDYHTQI